MSSALTAVANVASVAWVSSVNRGILSTQHLSRALIGEGKTPSPAALQPHIEKIGDKIRLELTGQLLGALTSIIERAKKEGGKCYAALYEFTDKELIAALVSLNDIELILSNNGTGDDGKPYDDGNAPSAAAFAGRPIYRRYMPKGQIGHNKFIVYVGPDGEPKSVLTGSTNWTPTGLCTQSNNCMIIESTDLAQTYLDYWDDLKADAERAGRAPRCSFCDGADAGAGAGVEPDVRVRGGRHGGHADRARARVRVLLHEARLNPS